MKLVVTKSHTIQVKNPKEQWLKFEYTIESDNIQENQLEKEKKKLEAKINEWLKEDLEQATTHKKTCKECGKAIKPQYTYCYECSQKQKKD